jgi:hypothetical protein
VSAHQELKATLKPLNITCTSSDCQNGLHCFRQTQAMATLNRRGRCRACGAELIDWSRVHRRDPADAAYTFAALKYELIRHHFWHVEIDLKAVNHARRKGKVGVRAAAENRVRKSVGPAEPPFDGRQTPREGSGNIIYYAQHVCPTCNGVVLSQVHRGMAWHSPGPRADRRRNHVPGDLGHTLCRRAVTVSHTSG